jgi:hypothetical protein
MNPVLKQQEALQVMEALAKSCTFLKELHA